MKCYIYFIINKSNQKRYVGQTTNFYRRKNEHLKKLRENNHPNIKLQSAFNKYGEENFYFEKITYDNITKEQLDQEEVKYIDYYNSREEGYNIAAGGTGGDTKSKLNFEQYCFAYFGNLKYSGMTNRTGKYLNVDSSCISAIVNKKSYDKYRQLADALSEEEKLTYITKFEQKLDIINNPPYKISKELDDENTLKFFCVASTYGRGIEKRLLLYFNKSKGFLYHAFEKDSVRIIPKQQYKNMTKEEIQKVGRQYYKEWNLNQYGPQLKESWTNLIEKYKKAS